MSQVSPTPSRFLGRLADDPLSPRSGDWWYNTTELNWKFYNGAENALLGGTFTKTESTPADAFGRPNTNPPGIVDQDNLTLYAFTVGTDRMTFKFPVPSDYDSGGLSFRIIWTNDGGVDDQNKNVKWQIDYQVGTEGDAINGSHANSPKTVQDTYTSASGWIEHRTGLMTIAATDFAADDCVYMKISAIAPTGTALSCDPHLIGICKVYTAKRDPD